MAALGQRFEDKLACVELYTRSVSENDLPTLGRSLLNSPLEDFAKDLGLATVVERSYYQDTGESARLTKGILDQSLRTKLEETIRKYAALKGTAVEARIEEIFSGPS